MEVKATRVQEVSVDIDDDDLIDALKKRFFPLLKGERFLIRDGQVCIMDRVSWDDYDFVPSRPATIVEIELWDLLVELKQQLSETRSSNSTK